MDKFCKCCQKETEHSVFTTDNRATYICKTCGYVEDIFVDDKLKEQWADQSHPQPNVPKCPTCGSTHIKEISTTKRMFGIFTAGLASGNMGKSYECLNCKYKW